MPFSLISKNEKALSPLVGTVIALAIVVILAAVIGAAVFGGSLGSSTKSGPMTNLEISEIDTKVLKLEHLGGDPLNFSKNLKIHFYHKGRDYELFYPYTTELLTSGDTKKLFLYDIVDLKAGDKAKITIVDEDRQSLIYQNTIRFQREHQPVLDENASVEEIDIELRTGDGELYIMFLNPTEKIFNFGDNSKDTICRVTSSGYTFELNNDWLYEKLTVYPDDWYIYHYGRFGGNDHNGYGVEPKDPNDERAKNEITKIIEGKSSPIFIYIQGPAGEIGRSYPFPVPYKNNSRPATAYDDTCI